MAISHKNSVLIAHTQRCVMRASLEEINSIFSALINMRYNSTHDLLFSIIVFITHTNNTNKQRRLKKPKINQGKKIVFLVVYLIIIFFEFTKVTSQTSQFYTIRLIVFQKEKSVALL